jgi:hypothetical protein
MNENETHRNPSVNRNDNPKIVALLREPSRRYQGTAGAGIRSGDRTDKREVETPRFNRQTPETERGSHATSTREKRSWFDRLTGR